MASSHPTIHPAEMNDIETCKKQQEYILSVSPIANEGSEVMYSGIQADRIVQIITKAN